MCDPIDILLHTLLSVFIIRQCGTERNGFTKTFWLIPINNGIIMTISI